MIDEVLIECGIGETRTALIEDGRAIEVMIDRDDGTDPVGAIYLGRVLRLEPGLAAAFVDIGQDRAGLLAPRDGSALNEGAAVVVQVRRPPLGTKGAKLTADIGLAGRLLVYHPRRCGVTVSRRITAADERRRLVALAEQLVDGDGLVARTAAAGAEGEALAREATALRARWRAIEAALGRAPVPSRLDRGDDLVARVLRDHVGRAVRRVLIDTPDGLAAAQAHARREMPELLARLARHDGPDALFDAYGVDHEIELALQRRVPLKSGGALTIEPTEAFLAIDVDSGAGGDRRGPAETALATNLEAAAEIARQLRLRAIGGNVVIDFIRMAGAKHGSRLRRALEEAFASDRADLRIAPLGELGLVALTRRLDRAPLAQLLVEPDPSDDRPAQMPTVAAAVAATLRRALREAAAGPPGPIRLIAAPELAAALAGRPADALGRRTGRAVVIEPAAELGRRRADVVVG